MYLSILNQSKSLTHTLANYFSLCKPKIIALLLVTALTGMQLAINDVGVLFSITMIVKMFIALLGIAFAAGSAAIINHLLDINIDSKMARTKQRATVKGHINHTRALFLSGLLALSSMILLISYVNALTALLTFCGLIGYAFIYTGYLKHKTAYNIVYGGLPGALPPLLGWTSISNSITLEGMVLLLIIFFWTPAHFWALAIDRIEDYKKASVPMLPVVSGINFTKNQIVIYALLTLACSFIPFITGLSGFIYLGAAIIAGYWYLHSCLKLKNDANNQTALPCFYASIQYLLCVFVALIVDHYWLIYAASA